MISATAAVEILNSLLSEDRKAISSLATNYVQCKKELGVNTAAAVGIDDDNNYSIGMVGVINSLVNNGKVAAVIGENRQVIEFIVKK
ncbi:hypothetical protein [Providencia rettgeri]|uniref:hypothetical protein n=1 Tax=Providencia rettgeri TaxID=587 RepID=UPI001BA527E1|nr:hypothetical protein [Providencia rettgeri]MBS0918183.1 hypothetical protein [Providencia rettgeri]